MGKPALLELLNLIELRLEDNPVLAYQTLLELIAFVKSDIQYQSYLPTLESIESSYQLKCMPQLLTPLPMPYFHGQTSKVLFQVPLFLKDQIQFKSETNLEIRYLEQTMLEVAFQPTSALPIQLDCYQDLIKLKTFTITLVSPVEMDNLGL